MFLAFVKKYLSSIPLGDLEGFDLIIFENLDKSLEFVCDEMPIQQFKSTRLIPFTKKNLRQKLIPAIFLYNYNELIAFLPFQQGKNLWQDTS